MADARPTTGRVQRPLSPHLQIYTPEINMVMSILHRITGAALYFGTLLLAWWLVAAATGPAYYDYVSGLLGSWFGIVVLTGYVWALVNHMLGGVRHFIWDVGRGYDIPTINMLCWASAGAAVLIALGVAAYGFSKMPAVAP